MRAEKQYVIEELKAQIGSASAVIFTNYTGTNAKKMGALRALLHEHRGGYMVVKNRLFALAAKAAGLDGELPGFGGQVGVAFSDEESSVPVLKALVEFNKAHEVLELLGGFISGRPCTAAELRELSKLPPKPVMQAQVLGMLLAVPRGFVTVLAGRLRSLLYLLKARIEQQGCSGNGLGDAEASPGGVPAEAPSGVPAEAPSGVPAEAPSAEPAGEASA